MSCLSERYFGSVKLYLYSLSKINKFGSGDKDRGLRMALRSCMRAV